MSDYTETFKRLMPRLSPAAFQLHAVQEFVAHLHAWVVDEWDLPSAVPDDPPREYKGNVYGDVTIDSVLEALAEVELRFEWDGNDNGEAEDGYFHFKCFNWPIDRLLHQQVEEFGGQIYNMTRAQIFASEVKLLLGHANLVVVEDEGSAIVIKAQQYAELAEDYDGDEDENGPEPDAESAK